MPLELQELSPKLDVDAIETQTRIPKLAVRDRKRTSGVTNTTPAALDVSPLISAKESKETLQSSDEKTISVPSPTAQIAPWSKVREYKYEPRHATTQSDGFTASTNELSSCDTGKQPFRHEVCINSNHS